LLLLMMMMMMVMLDACCCLLLLMMMHLPLCKRCSKRRIFSYQVIPNATVGASTLWLF